MKSLSNLRFATALAVFLGFTLSNTVGANFTAERDQNWHHWRGPTGNGVVKQGNPPTRWDASTNIKWKVDLPGHGASSPIIWGNRIFILSAVDTGQRAANPPVSDPRNMTRPSGNIFSFQILCLERNTGKLLWQRTAVETAPHEGMHKTNTYAGGSPTTDGERLYISFGSRGIYCYDLDGTPLWHKNVGKMRTRLGWGEASTLVIHEDHLILPWDQEDQSYLYSLNPKTGDIQWRVERDEPSNWSTPLITTHDDRTQLIVNGTNRARSYFLDSGEMVWECGELSVNAIPSPLRYKDTILCISGYRKSIVYAIPVDARGDISGTNRILWTYNKNTPYVASPVIAGNKMFLTKQRTALVTVLDLDTGKPLIEAERLNGLREVYASPIVANDKVYLVDRQGTTAVLTYDGELKILAVNKLGDQIDASPAVVGNQLFLRSSTALYCIEE